MSEWKPGDTIHLDCGCRGVATIRLRHRCPTHSPRLELPAGWDGERKYTDETRNECATHTEQGQQERCAMAQPGDEDACK